MKSNSGVLEGAVAAARWDMVVVVEVIRVGAFQDYLMVNGVGWD